MENPAVPNQNYPVSGSSLPAQTAVPQPQTFSPQPVAQSPTVQAVQKTDPLVSQKKKSIKPLIMITLLILGLVLIAGLSFFVYQYVAGTMAPPPTPGGKDDEDVVKPLDPSTWTAFENKEYGFGFKHPDLDDSCCHISGPGSPMARNVLNLTDEETIDFPGSDQKFDGIGFYVDSNLAELEFDAYLNREIDLQKQQYKLATGDEYISGGVNEVVTAGANDQFTGRKLAGFTTDMNERYYFLFPDNKMILIMSLSHDEKPRFPEVFDLLLSTLVFSRAEVKACNNTTFNMTSNISETWTCETIIKDTNSLNDLVETTVKSDLYTIVISNPKDPPLPCISSGKETQIGCFFNDFYIRPDFSLQMYQLNSENLKIYGLLKSIKKTGDVYMTIDYKDIETRTLTEEEKAPLFLFLDSIDL